MAKKTARSRVVLITGLTGIALATAGCPLKSTTTTNPPPIEDTGDTGESGDTGDTASD